MERGGRGGEGVLKSSAVARGKLYFEGLTDPRVSLTMINDLSHPTPPLLEKDV